MLAFMLNPKKKVKRKAPKKARRRATAWAKCLSAAHGNAKIASGLLRKHKGCRLPKTLRKTLRAKLGKAGYRVRAKSARARASALKFARRLKRSAAPAAARLKAIRAAQAAAWANPRPKKKHRKAKHKRRKNMAKRHKKRKHARKSNPRRRKAKMHRVKKGKRIKRRGRRTLKGGQLTRRRRKGKTRRSRRTKRGGWSNNPMDFSPGNILKRVQSVLTSTDKLTMFAVGAAGGTVSLAAGNFLASQARSLSGQDAPGSMLAKGEWGGIALDIAAQITAGVALSTLLPAKYQGAFIFGTGVAALSDTVNKGLRAIVPADYQKTLGLTGWMPVGGPRQSGGGLMGGSLSGWISVDQVRSMRGLRGAPVQVG